jgi:hypothetical protein
MNFNELWRANIPREGRHVNSVATQEAAGPQSIEATEERDELELTNADLLFLFEVGIRP